MDGTTDDLSMSPKEIQEVAKQQDALPPAQQSTQQRPGTTKNYRTKSRNGKSKKVAQALRSASTAPLSGQMQARGNFIIPHDGLYSAEQICKMLGITRQSLCYHTNKQNIYRRLYYVRKPDDGKPKRGARMFFVTAIELYRFCLVNSYAFPPGIDDAINNYNRCYGTDDWGNFRRLFQSNTSGVYQAADTIAGYTPPPQNQTLPAPLVKGPFDAASPKVPLIQSPLSSGNDPLTEMLK